MASREPSTPFFKPTVTSTTIKPKPGAQGRTPRKTPSKVATESHVHTPLPEKRKVKKLFELPALSICRRETFETVEKKEEHKRKILRRIIPPTENIEKLKEVIRRLRGQDVTVQEYVGLVAPYTGDNAQVLREIMANELCSFRSLANSIYNTMTQDVSDVLTNEHVQLIAFQNEQINLYQQRMMKAIDTIQACVQDFNFQAYHDNPEEYLKSGELDEEQQDLLLRQQAFHRLQWLKTEGERLGEENGMLQQRLNELKAMANEENQRKMVIEDKAESKRNSLVAEENDLQDQLMDMQTQVQRSLVESEKLDSALASQRADVGERDRSPKSKPSPKDRSDFAIKAAIQIETGATEELKEATLSTHSVAVVQSKGAIKKKMTKRRKPRPAWEDIPVEIVERPAAPAAPRQTSPFHFSPPRSPPRQQAAAAAPRQVSPFHYSPTRQASPPPQQRSPFHYSPPRQAQPQQQQQQQQRSPFHYSPNRAEQAAAEAPPQRRRVERTTTTTEPIPGVMRRRGQAPRDTWGGYY